MMTKLKTPANACARPTRAKGFGAIEVGEHVLYETVVCIYLSHVRDDIIRQSVAVETKAGLSQNQLHGESALWPHPGPPVGCRC